MLLHYLRKCSSSKIASFHSNAVSLLCQFQAVAAWYLQLVDSQLILMLLYDSLNRIISGVHQSHLSCWGHRSEKWSWEVWPMLHTRCACVLSYWKTKLLSAMCFVAINILANVNSCSCSLFVVVRPSVCRLSSVTFVHPTQAMEIFGNVSAPCNTLMTWQHPGKILRRSSQGNPSVGGVKPKSGRKI